ncbi:MAG: 4a-hydroxytetrahydrobiopterin dehydratase [Chloroflexi bacterium]|nr:4a-hydroxytetrahydrobiopterin dehydratase [Chloroflexota bacterium]
MAKLNESDIAERMPTVPGWAVIEEEGINRLQSVFTFGDFTEALAFTNRVGELAEHADHHPRIVTEWGRVTLTWWSHDQGGIVAKDFEMAKRVDAG